MLDPQVPELASLALLVSVSDLGSLGRAARAHHISEPAASVRIRRLERQIGLRLFDRSPTGTTPTAAGTVITDWARTVLAAANQLAASLTALRAETGGRLVVAASMTVAEYMVPAWLLALRLTAPDASVALRVGNSVEVADLVYGGAAAIGFVETPRRFAGLQDVVVAHDTLVVVVSPRSPWAQTPRPITVHDLHTARLIVREEGSGTRDTLGDAMARHGLTLTPDLVLGSTTAIKMAVALDEGVGVLSELAVSPEVRDGRLVTVPTDMQLSRTIRAIWPAAHAPTGAAADLLAIARSRR